MNYHQIFLDASANTSEKRNVLGIIRRAPIVQHSAMLEERFPVLVHCVFHQLFLG